MHRGRMVATFGNVRLWRKAITIDHTKVAADQTDFSVLVLWAADSDLAGHSRADGSDLLFVASNGTTVLKFEVEKFTHSTGELVAWVKIPSLSSSVDTVIYLYYGNSAPAVSRQDGPNTWPSDFALVAHLSDTPPTTSGAITSITGFPVVAEQVIVVGSNLYAVFGDTGATGRHCFKVDLTSFTLTSTLTNAFSTYCESAVSDGTYLYVGVWVTSGGTPPAEITRIRLSDFTVVDTLTLSSGEFGPAGLQVIGTKLYVSCWVSPGKIVRIDLTTFTREAVLTLPSGVTHPEESTNDGTYFYATCEDAAKIVKVDLSSFTYVSDIQLTAGWEPQQALYDGGYIYAVCRNGLNSGLPGKLVKVPVSNFTAGSVQSIDVIAEANSIVKDGSYFYIGNFNGGAQAVARIDISAFTMDSIVNLTAGGQGEGIQAYSGAVYIGQNTSLSNTAGKITKVSESLFGLATRLDSTSNAIKGAFTPHMSSSNQVAGEISGSLNFDGTNDWIDLFFSAKMTGNFSVSAWIYKPASLPTEAGIVVRRSPGGSNINYQITWDTSGPGLNFYVAGSPAVYNTAVSTGWHLVHGTWDNATHTRKLYLDGALVATDATAGSIVAIDSQQLSIGRKTGIASTNWNSKVDEVRIAAVTRTSTWITTEFNNQSSPSTFYSVGAETKAVQAF